MDAAARRDKKLNHGSLKSPACSCVSTTLPASSWTRMTAPKPERVASLL